MQPCRTRHVMIHIYGFTWCNCTMVDANAYTLSRHTWLATIYHNLCLGLRNLSKWDPFDVCRFRFENVWMGCLHYFEGLNRFGRFLSISHVYLLLYYHILFVCHYYLSFRWKMIERKKILSIQRIDFELKLISF